MIHARLVELGITGYNLLAAALAIAVGMQVSVWAGLLVFAVMSLGFLSLFYNFDAWLVRRLISVDDRFMLNLCSSGFIGRTRFLLKGLPANPRCRFCLVPFGGIGKLIGIRPSAKNPNFCRSCFEGLPTQTHEVEVGVLFADIRGFTSWTENHPTKDASDALTRFYSIANKALTSDDAFVEFVGDQVMALYLVDMPSMGSRSAEIMLAGARRLVEMIREERDILPVGVGLNIGRAQVGTIAKGESKDFTAVGDVVNTAARMQGTAGEYEIVLSEDVYRAVLDQVPEAKLTTLDLKGKAEPLNAYVVAATE